jgi:hypothetical protein
MENKNRSARRALIYGGLYMVAFFGAMTHFAVEYIGSKMNKSQPEQLEKSQPVKMQKKQYENDSEFNRENSGFASNMNKLENFILYTNNKS